MKIPVEAKSIDELLSGGIETDALTLFYGDAGSGKTNICLQLARNVARKGFRMIYLDSEGVSPDRLHQMCGSDFDEIIPKILFYRPFSFEEQEAQLDDAIRVASGAKDIKLVILDSATVFFRLKQGETDQGRSSLSYQIVRLLTLARKLDIAVVMTSQVYLDIEHKVIKPLGGHTLYHNAKTILQLDRLDAAGRRKMTIMKHRCLPEGASCEFILTGKGVE
jgi:DNA repair protein RadB